MFLQYYRWSIGPYSLSSQDNISYHKKSGRTELDDLPIRIVGAFAWHLAQTIAFMLVIDSKCITQTTTISLEIVWSGCTWAAQDEHIFFIQISKMLRRVCLVLMRIHIYIVTLFIFTHIHWNEKQRQYPGDLNYIFVLIFEKDEDENDSWTRSILTRI